MVKYLLCEIVTEGHFQSPIPYWGERHIYLEEQFDFHYITINFKNLYAQGKCDEPACVECGPMNLSPKVQLNTLMIPWNLV